MIWSSGMSLKYRLLVTGLLCAALTGITGLAGILSLRLIHGKIEDSTDHIRSNMAEQNTKINQVVSLRSLVQAIDGAENSHDLSATNAVLEKLQSSWTLSTQDRTQGVMNRAAELQTLKSNQLRAQGDLETFKQAHYINLEEIRSHALLISDDTEFDSTMAIEDAFSTIENHFNQMLLSSDNALSSTKAATSLHTFCFEIDAKVKEIYLSSDAAFISYLKHEIQTRLDNVRLTLDCIHANASIVSIRSALDRLVANIDSMFEEKLRNLDGSSLDRTEASPMESYKTRINEIIDMIRNQASQTQDDTEFDGVMKLETAMSDIDMALKDMASLMGEELQTIKTALALRHICTQLDARTMEALSIDDPEILNYLKTEVLTLLGNAHDRLEDLPDHETKVDIHKRIKILETLTSQLFDTKDRTIDCNRQFSEVYALIHEQMTGTENRMIALAEDVKGKAERTMLECSSAVSRWQSLEIALVCGAFLLAVIIGAILSRSVTQQLQQLNQGIRMAGEGDLDHKVDTGVNDEIGDLSRVFDNMTRKLSTREHALIESEQRFRKLFELSNDGIIIHNRGQEILHANKRMAEMIGYGKKHFMGKGISDLHTPEERERAAEIFGESDPNRMQQFESSYTKSNGDTITVDIRSSIIDPKEGVIQSIVRDITQQKRAEHELNQHMQEVSEANRHLEVLVANTTDREQKMVELKKEINYLLESNGQSSKYEAPERVEELLSQGCVRNAPLNEPTNSKGSD